VHRSSDPFTSGYQINGWNRERFGFCNEVYGHGKGTVIFMHDDEQPAEFLHAQITAVMDQFEKQFEDLDVQSEYIEQAMSQSTSLSTPVDQVDTLISQVAEEHGMHDSKHDVRVLRVRVVRVAVARES
jgi:hypothetical protein